MLDLFACIFTWATHVIFSLDLQHAVKLSLKLNVCPDRAKLLNPVSQLLVRKDIIKKREVIPIHYGE